MLKHHIGCLHLWMRLRTSYRQILAISAPIMLGSAAQNVIALSDSVFLYHLSEEDFATIGFVGVFYLVVAAIGYGFSRGGQIMIARRMGEGQLQEIGRTFYSMVYFEAGLALAMFLFMQFGSYYLFSLLVDSPLIFAKSLEYLDTRSWGVFFSYVGVSIIALYTGVARTNFIIADTILLGVVNIVLDYALIFGHWGFPAMGIAGAGLASTIAEGVAFVAFIIYILFDKQARTYRLFKFPRMDMKLIKQQYRLALPIVAQAFVGMGSWFLFFGIVENLGERELAITNLVRMVYLVLSIPSWGFAAGVNTMVSTFIGQRKRQAVIPIIWKTAWMSWAATMFITLPVVLFPQQMLYPLLGSEDMSLIADAQPIFWMLTLILTLFSIGSVFFNGMAGTGATFYGLIIQTICAIFYLIYIYVEVNYTRGGLLWAWAAEIFYWGLMIGLIIWYLRSRNWHGLTV
jgi:putative MATE family efflux protein